jgi:uncharacterized Zn finger protein (UPF0148 family)
MANTNPYCGTNPTAPKPGEPGYVKQWYVGRTCPNRGKVQREDGTWYCGMHDPVAKKEKQQAKADERNRHYDALTQRRLKFEAERDVREAAAKARIEKLAAFGVPGGMTPATCTNYTVYGHSALSDFTGGVTFSEEALDYLLAAVSALEAQSCHCETCNAHGAGACSAEAR